MRKATVALFAALIASIGSIDPSGRVTLEPQAEASVAITLSVDELVEASSLVVIATAVERRSQWEELPSGKRIVTYTRMTVDETIGGDSNRSEVWVRTLGGKVGKIGQQVSGEAELAIDQRALVFLADFDEGSDAQGNRHRVTVVTGMGQGHYPIDESGKDPILKASPDAGTLLHRRGPSVSAAEALVGKKLDLGREVVREASQRKLESDRKRQKK